VRSYSAGSAVFYNKGSTHRPLSIDGARVLYIPFDGIIFGKSPEDLVAKMHKVGTSEEALEYALHWMVPDEAERRKIMERLVI